VVRLDFIREAVASNFPCHLNHCTDSSSTSSPSLSMWLVTGSRPRVPFGRSIIANSAP
jgi:hypothetical protein